MADQVSGEYRELFLKAKEALKFSYSPFSGFAVGACIRTADGKTFTGTNVENSSYGAAICAERVACVKAVSEGEKDFDAIAVAAEKGAASPCGICRQFLYEFSPDMDVITGEDSEHLKVDKLSDLLRDGFRLEK